MNTQLQKSLTANAESAAQASCKTMFEKEIVQGNELQETNVFVRDDYSENQNNRRDCYEERAMKASKESTAKYKRSRDLVDCIPFGQPILIGHHSERGHRNRLNKSWAAMGKSVELSEKSMNLESKAAGVGTAGIASDDPEAVIKLKNRLESLESAQIKMKAANKLVRKNDLQGLIKLGFSEIDAANLLKPDFANRTGFPSYALQNNNAEIRRTTKRIEDLQKIHNSKPYEFKNENFKIYIADGRVRVSFLLGKPTAEVCKIMSKEYSFNWSSYAVEWVRKVTPNSLAIAPRLADKLNALASIY